MSDTFTIKEVEDNVFTIKEVEDNYARFASGKGEIILYEGMSDGEVLKIINNAFKKAKGAPFTVQQLPDFNEAE